MAFKDGLASFLLTWSGVHTAFSFNQTGANTGTDTSHDANSSIYGQADTANYPNYGLAGYCNPDSNGDMDIYIITDACMLLYIPEDLATDEYALFHNGGGTHGQMGQIRSQNNGETITLGITHNANGTQQDYTTVEITERGWVCIGFQFEDNSGNMAIWVNGVNVAEISRTYALAYGSGNPRVGDGAADAIPGWTACEEINGTGMLIANFVCDNPNNDNSNPAGCGDSFYTDYYDEHLAGGGSFEYEGDLSMAAVPSSTRVLDMVFAGALGLALLTSSARAVDMTYVGALSATVSTSHTAVMEYPYAGAMAFDILPASTYGLFVEYGYSGALDIALKPNYTAIGDMVYGGSVPLTVLPSYVSIVDRTYDGVLGVNLTPSYLSALEKGYIGSIPLSLLSGVQTALEKSYDGQLALVLVPVSEYSLEQEIEEYIYGGALDLGLVPSYGSILDRIYGGQLGLSLTPSHSVIREMLYAGDIPLIVLPSYTSLAEKSYSGVLQLALVPASIYELSEAAFIYGGALSLLLVPSHTAILDYIYLGDIRIGEGGGGVAVYPIIGGYHVIHIG